MNKVKDYRLADYFKMKKKYARRGVVSGVYFGIGMHFFDALDALITGNESLVS
ncbi:hypothetical protein [Liquorilactobacillus uvarum]|uniref:Uncharacterized protein n=1 Tax=Liquorilactobacillus uvarum DSM 19971 TaxID=1423812 RepID=A0A0R1Q2W4_9LACO|nr:hypothetical protein [Liquorilactobacillus uvarum]KRL38969.1 hypothetical protein FD20_GL000004 [Liquorilactobacillus uvarum DSM 19971]